MVIMKNRKYLIIPIYIFLSLTVTTGCFDFFGFDESYDPPLIINQPPVISGLNNLFLSPGFGVYEIDFANYVSDQEGEIINYQVSNSDELVIAVSLDNTVLTISEVGAGSSDITVTATDGRDAHDVSASFTVIIASVLGAEDYTGVASVLIDFNGLGTGSVVDNPIPNFTFEGLTYEHDGTDFGSITLENNDHLMITHNVSETYIWSEYNLGGNQDFTGKKLRFDYSHFTAPTLSGAHWEDDPTAADIQLYFVDETWGASGGQKQISSLNLEYAENWQTVEILLSDFISLWGLPADPSTVGYIGIEVWGGEQGDPISFRIDNLGIVD
mgnify:FL=1